MRGHLLEREQRMSGDAMAIMSAMHDEKLGVERMVENVRLLEKTLAPVHAGKGAMVLTTEILRGCEHLLAAYEQLCEACALGGLCLSEIDLEALACRVMRTHEGTAVNAGVRLWSRAPIEPLIAQVDAMLIERMLSNLLSNALRHTKRGGEVVIELAYEGECAVIGVRDNGCGVAPELVEHMFEMFVSGSGTAWHGIGLSNVRKIVQMHGGEIHCSSHAGEGTTIEARIPLRGVG